MNLPLEFHPAVRRELDIACRWYESREQRLTTRFMNEVEHIIDEIRSNPTRFGFAAEDIRVGTLKRFPFAVYYRVLPDRIRILAVFHTAKDPLIWQSRV